VAATRAAVSSRPKATSRDSIPSRATAAASRSAAGAIGVNGFLWRASLDTLAFMPLASADPYGGVIVTDWYTNPEKPDERFKATVYILDTRLRADGLNVTIFKQVKDAVRRPGPTRPPPNRRRPTSKTPS
jgi:hypothetical protein